MPVTLPRPADLHGGALVAELRAAGIDVPDDGVRDESDGTIVVVTDAAESDVRAVVDAHVPPTPEPTKDDKLADLRTKAEALPTNNPVRPILLGLIDAV